MRGGGHHARARALSGDPVSSLLTGCWAPPSSFPAPYAKGASGASLPEWDAEVKGCARRHGGWDPRETAGRKVGSRRDFRETRGARGAAAPARDRSGRRARASAPRQAGVLGPRRESAATGRARLRNARGRFRGTLGFMLVPESPRGSGSRTKRPPSRLIAVPAVLCSLSGGRTDVLQVVCSWHTPGKAAVRASSNEVGALRGSDLGPWSEICAGVLAPPPDLDLPGLIARVRWTGDNDTLCVVDG